MYFIYIIFASRFDRYYIGQTNDLSSRIDRHNLGYVQSTKHYLPWELVYSESFKTRTEAMKREKVLKSWKSKKKIKELVDASR